MIKREAKNLGEMKLVIDGLVNYLKNNDALFASKRQNERFRQLSWKKFVREAMVIKRSSTFRSTSSSTSASKPTSKPTSKHKSTSPKNEKTHVLKNKQKEKLDLHHFHIIHLQHQKVKEKFQKFVKEG